MDKLSLRDLPIKGKKVLMRVDFNVPLNDQGMITDDSRLVASLPSIQYILNHDASLVLMSHLGRPKDKKDSQFSLKPCADHLSKLLNRPVAFAEDCIGQKAEQKVNALRPGEVLLLENLRFHRGEEHPEEERDFAKKLASFGDFYVNDAFGSSHRKHTSTATITSFFPEKAAAGFLLEKEIQFLGQALLNPKRPFYAILGGSKISSKCGVIEALLKKADKVLIGGGMTYTFLKAQGISIGNSIHEDDFIKKAQELLSMNKQENPKLFLPTDVIVTDSIKNGQQIQISDTSEGIPDGLEGADIGPHTIENYSHLLEDAKTILWNGPLGVFENPAFAKGTNAIAQRLAELKATTIVGGGDSIAAIQAAGLADKMTHLSTGGGASLEYIEFGTLPGIDALSNK